MLGAAGRQVRGEVREAANQHGGCPTPSGRVLSPVLTRNLPTHLGRQQVNHAHLAHVHLASRRVRLTDRSSTFSLRPQTDRRRWPCPRTTKDTTPQAHLRARGPVSARRWSAARAEEDARPSSTCAGCSRRVTARRGCPAAPPGPGGEPLGDRLPDSAGIRLCTHHRGDGHHRPVGAGGDPPRPRLGTRPQPLDDGHLRARTRPGLGPHPHSPR